MRGLIILVLSIVLLPVPASAQMDHGDCTAYWLEIEPYYNALRALVLDAAAGHEAIPLEEAARTFQGIFDELDKHPAPLCFHGTTDKIVWTFLAFALIDMEYTARQMLGIEIPSWLEKAHYNVGLAALDTQVYICKYVPPEITGCQNGMLPLPGSGGQNTEEEQSV